MKHLLELNKFTGSFDKNTIFDYRMYILEKLVSDEMNKEIEYLVNKLTEFEDRGYIISIDICMYSERPDPGGENYVEGIVGARYETGHNDEKMEIDKSLMNPAKSSYDVIDAQYRAFKEGRICYQLFFDNINIDSIYDEVVSRFSRFELLRPSYSLSKVYKTGIFLKSKLGK